MIIEVQSTIAVALPRIVPPPVNSPQFPGVPRVAEISIPIPNKVFVERFPEPITGWEMLGAGAIWEAASCPTPLEIEILYDGEPRVQSLVECTELSPVLTRYRFGVQLPCEPNVRTVRVILRAGSVQTILFTGEPETIRVRGTTEGPPKKPVPRWLSPFVTLGTSIARGQVFSPSWWTARFHRYRDLALKGQQRIRDKLLIRSGFRPQSVHDAYVKRTDFTPLDLADLRKQAERFAYQPTISILVPVFNVEPKWLAAAVDSVRNQVYPYWELCLADDASTNPTTLGYLNRLPSDPRIKLVRRPKNGHICAATNSAAELATGEFVSLLDNDDALAPHALFAIVKLLQDQPDADLIYSDEDKLNAEGHRYDPQFKPDWSPDLLLSYNYINHFTTIRRSIFEQSGRFREGYEGSQDHDLLLRVTERTDRVYHIPEILYHWRSLPSSTASTAGVKRYVHTSGRKAIDDALTRRKREAKPYIPPFAEKLGLPILALDGPDTGPTIAVIVHGPAPAAAHTVRAVKTTTAYRDFTVYLVLDESNSAEALNRFAAGRDEEFLLFLEAGLEPSDPRWLSRLLANCTHQTGAVGGLIRTADGTIVSAGTILGLADGIAPGDAFANTKPEPLSYYFYAEVTRTVSAPANGCLLTRRVHFERLGGFDSDRFGRTLYDLEYCLRLSSQGLRSVHVGESEFVKNDPTPQADSPSELRALRAAYGFKPDPYSNPNFSSWDSFTPRSDATHLLPAAPATAIPVLFATHNLTAFEGAPKIIQDVALGLVRRGSITASVYAPSPGKAASAFTSQGIPVFAEETPFAKRFIDGQWTPSEYASAQHHLARILKRLRPHVVLANTLGMFPLIEAAARLGIPAVLAIQESYPQPIFNSLFSPYGCWRCERSFLFADRVIFASKSCAELYRRLGGRKNFEVIHNGLAAAPFDDFQRRLSKADAVAKLPGPHGNGMRFVTVGTVCERKAQHVLVEAAAIVARERRDFHCDLVGAREGLPYLSYCRNLIRKHGIDNVVSLIGETDQVRTYLRAADVFVLTSYVEAYSLSVMEAEAFGLPILATPAGGLDEQVAWNQNALRFDFGDAKALARHLQTLLGNPELCRTMGRESRAAFDLRLNAEGMLDCYLQAILSAAGVKATSGSRKAISPRARVA